jgi:lipoprotein signal peptidase
VKLDVSKKVKLVAHIPIIAIAMAMPAIPIVGLLVVLMKLTKVKCFDGIRLDSAANCEIIYTFIYLVPIAERGISISKCLDILKYFN